jgi:hypothetical protein
VSLNFFKPPDNRFVHDRPLFPQYAKKNRAEGSVPSTLFHAIAPFESFHASTCVDDSLLPGIKRMTFPAHFNAQLRFSRPHVIHCSAGARHGRSRVARMDFCFHPIHLFHTPIPAFGSYASFILAEI